MSEGQLKQGLPPVFRTDARVLILGSLPGDTSLAKRQYYAHPSNHFWRLMESVIADRLLALTYPQRIERLCGHGVALWDMVARGTRKGSPDHALKTHSLQEIGSLARRLTGLRLIAFNGTRAGALGSGLPELDQIAQIQLPSSSAANTMPLEEKLRQWARLADFL